MIEVINMCIELIAVAMIFWLLYERTALVVASPG